MNDGEKVGKTIKTVGGRGGSSRTAGKDATHRTPRRRKSGKPMNDAGKADRAIGTVSDPRASDQQGRS